MQYLLIPARRRAKDGVRCSPLCLWQLPFLPVDTHVYRVSRRLGLVAEDVKPEKAQTILEKIVPVEKYLSLHLNLIRHGRLICRARGPRHEGVRPATLLRLLFAEPKALNDSNNHPQSALR